MNQFFICVSGVISIDVVFVPGNWVFSLIAGVLFRSGRSILSCRALGVIYILVKQLGVVCGTALVFLLMGFCRV